MSYDRKKIKNPIKNRRIQTFEKSQKSFKKSRISNKHEKIKNWNFFRSYFYRVDVLKNRRKNRKL